MVRGKIDYSSVRLPDPEEKPYEEWDEIERRAYLMGKSIGLSHPKKVVQVEEAERFGVVQQTISKDMKKVAESWREYTDPGEMEKMIYDEYIKVLNKADSEDEINSHLRAINKVKEFFQEMGMVNKEPEKHEVKADISSEVDKIIQFSREDDE